MTFKIHISQELKALQYIVPENNHGRFLVSYPVYTSNKYQFSLDVLKLQISVFENHPPLHISNDYFRGVSVERCQLEKLKSGGLPII